MKVPKDIWECHLCGASPSKLSCEACLETVCVDCARLLWVVRKNTDYCHLLCEDCTVGD